MSPILRALFLASLFLFAACAPDAVPGNDGRRGRVGKADTVEGSCEESNACGAQSGGGCWCDSLCMFYGDCCADTAEFCDIDECNATENTGCPEGETCMAVGDANNCQVPPGADCPDWNDPAVHYTSFDINVCAVIRFSCDEDQEGFSDPDCGCGCAPARAAMCGGFGAFMCEGENEYCDYGSHCGSGDQSGLCQVKPEACTAHYDPVCGCDNQTYSNSCYASAAGVSVQSHGECAPAPNSCQSHCGGQSEDASCWCDSLCTSYGDCCDDKTAACG